MWVCVSEALCEHMLLPSFKNNSIRHNRFVMVNNMRAAFHYNIVQCTYLYVIRWFVCAVSSKHSIFLFCYGSGCCSCCCCWWCSGRWAHDACPTPKTKSIAQREWESFVANMLCGVYKTWSCFSNVHSKSFAVAVHSRCLPVCLSVSIISHYSTIEFIWRRCDVLNTQ